MQYSIKTHNGKLTIVNTVSGNHRTFKIETQPASANFAPGARVVYLLTGSNNQVDYTGFGFVMVSGEVAVWRSKRDGVFEKYAKMLSHPELYERRGIRYEFSVLCRRCNRELTTPTSLASGIGPVCAEIEQTGR